MSIRERLDGLLLRIKSGEHDLMPELWETVERLVAWQANRTISKLPAAAGVTFEDLYNSGYIALDSAVKRYSSDKGEFISLFMLCLKGAFAEARGFRSEKSKNDPLLQSSTGSLDAPLQGAEDVTLSDTIEDTTDAYEGIDESVYNEQLHNELERVLSLIPADESNVLRRRYYDNLTVNEAAEVIGEEPTKARQLERNALKNIRQSERFRNLEQFVEGSTIYYQRGGIKSFRITGTSTTEYTVITRESLRERFAKDEEKRAREREEFAEYCEKVKEKHERLAREEYANISGITI